MKPIDMAFLFNLDAQGSPRYTCQVEVINDHWPFFALAAFVLILALCYCFKSLVMPVFFAATTRQPLPAVPPFKTPHALTALACVAVTLFIESVPKLICG